jgi:Chaperone of endosialidase
MKTPTLSTNYIHRSFERSALLPVLLLLACFALSPHARAVCQEGCLTNNNTVLGEDALINNTGLGWNTAIGFNALYSNTTGFGNTAVGYVALFSNTTGISNTAFGYNALSINTTGIENTANGVSALSANTTGTYNTAIGAGALGLSTTGESNTATGFVAFEFNTTASFNTANGRSALEFNTTGNSNTANGYQALYHNTTGTNNTANGANALLNNRIGANNIALGSQAGLNVTGDNNIDIGAWGKAGESNTIRIGAGRIHTGAYIIGISGATVPTGVPVIIDTNGHLGTTTSSARFKDEVKPMDKTSEAILALQPVTFRYKKNLDPDGVPQFGLIAEQVEKVNPDLVARDDQGKVYTVRYDAVNAMLLNEFLKEHKAFVAEQRKVQEQSATIARLERQIEALTTGLQEVKAQIETSRLTPQMVVSSH